ncbi:ARMT1-like domain-containing protein [uncultured Pseudodesulfovibrio sp.]|uniref:damage-control phosphatase ARMT1 family protein n=1 Tax=uncultured Pseudodesulfovibrio sp. TaxID=2035858 RepID=UPI0029C74BCA|nr:ARMT1-like domain-containing protein [uncultured Pseudodesulfovibrio sp.]
MNTSLECMPCFMKMVLREAQLACPNDEEMHQKIVMAWGRKLGELDLTLSPPAIARHLGNLVSEMTGCSDLYLEDKREANLCVLKMLPALKKLVEDERVAKDGDSFGLALELAIIGNYIDRGVDIDIDWESELKSVSQSVSPDTLNEVKAKAAPGANILVLGDNTGEIVLDMLLVEELQRRGCKVTYVVRSQPVINDSTMVDAEFVGMTKLCEVIESGVDTPGTVLERCKPEFLDQMREADLILSKGQGNFEALEGRWPNVYCAFKVKCKRVAADAGLDLWSSVLYKTKAPASDVKD